MESWEKSERQIFFQKITEKHLYIFEKRSLGLIFLFQYILQSGNTPGSRQFRRFLR